jgi:hypothetical protein
MDDEMFTWSAWRRGGAWEREEEGSRETIEL